MQSLSTILYNVIITRLNDKTLINDVVLMCLKKNELRKMNVDAIVIFSNKGRTLLESKYEVILVLVW